jgi:epoxide hydrolase A/B
MAERVVETNGVELFVVDEGDGPPVILSHGFPELSYSWRHQIPALAAAGYRVLAPDQRGYGRSSRPGAIEDYDIVHLTDDLVGLLDDIGVEQAVIVGHDWGAMVANSAVQLRPERFAAVCTMSVPMLPRAPMPPVQMMRAAFADNFFYIVYFQEPGVADADLGADAAETMRRLLAGLRTAAPTPEDMARAMAKDDRGFVDRLPEFDGLPSWLSQEELDHYIAEFTRTGFTGGINWYRNMDRNWELTAHLAGTKLEKPAFFIAGSADIVIMMTPPSMMEGFVTDLRGTVIVDGAGHWVQQERPDEVNEALLGFLAEAWPA